MAENDKQEGDTGNTPRPAAFPSPLFPNMSKTCHSRTRAARIPC